MQVFSITVEGDFHMEANTPGEARRKLKDWLEGVSRCHAFLDIVYGKAFPNAWSLKELIEDAACTGECKCND